MGMAAILVMWQWPFEKKFSPHPHGGSIWNLASTGQVASAEKMFENVDVRRTTEAYLSFKLTNGLGELINQKQSHYKIWYIGIKERKDSCPSFKQQ